MPSITIFNGDAEENLNYITPESIDLIITSPPYWNLVDYKKEDQLGFGMSYENYLEKLQIILTSCVKALKKSKVLIVNVADVMTKFTHQNNSQTPHIISITADIINYLVNDLNLLLFRDITWHKTNYTSSGMKGANYNGKTYPRNISPHFDTEHILVFIKPDFEKKANCSCKSLSENLFDGIPNSTAGKWRSNLWPIAKQQDSTLHPASFPEDIPYRLIRLFSLEGEIVLDPFMGKGTTLKLAACLKRNSVGIELNETYIANFEKQYLTSTLDMRKIDSSSLYDYCMLIPTQKSVFESSYIYDIECQYFSQQKLE